MIKKYFASFNFHISIKDEGGKVQPAAFQGRLKSCRTHPENLTLISQPGLFGGGQGRECFALASPFSGSEYS